MYVSGNPKTKAELKRLVKEGKQPAIISAWAYPAPTNGRASVEGPHYPAPHTWYANVLVKDGLIVKVIS